jgi:hypothetical protein
MATLKQLCEQNELPFKVYNCTWDPGQYCEIKFFNSLDVIGFNSDGEGVTYPIKGSKFWNLYTEPEPKKDEDQAMLEKLLTAERERILAEVLPGLQKIISETNGFDVSTNYFRDQKLTTANKMAKELLEKLQGDK